MRMDVRYCAAFRARRLNAGLVHELLRQDHVPTSVTTMQNQSNFKQLCRLTFCSDDGISCEPYESRHHSWPHAKRLQSSMPFCDPSGLGASSTARVGIGSDTNIYLSYTSMPRCPKLVSVASPSVSVRLTAGHSRV